MYTQTFLQVWLDGSGCEPLSVGSLDANFLMFSHSPDLFLLSFGGLTEDVLAASNGNRSLVNPAGQNKRVELSVRIDGKHASK
jgi:hypothetical protein